MENSNQFQKYSSIYSNSDNHSALFSFSGSNRLRNSKMSLDSNYAPSSESRSIGFVSSTDSLSSNSSSSYESMQKREKREENVYNHLFTQTTGSRGLPVNKTYNFNNTIIHVEPETTVRDKNKLEKETRCACVIL